MRSLRNRVNGLQVQLLAAEDAAAQAVRAADRDQARARALAAELQQQRHVAQAQPARIAELQAASAAAQAELQRVREQLERELSFHKAEHQNSVGAGIALHQEIAQLKAELHDAQAMTVVVEGRELRALEGVQTLDAALREQRAVNEQLRAQLDAARQAAQASAVAASFAPPPGTEEQLEELRGQLAAAEATVASLQGDLQREIKRADVSKRVYEAKLAELQAGH